MLRYKNWRTPTGPGSVYAALDAELHFTMDAAASHANALLPIYCTEEGKFVKVEPKPTKGNPNPDFAPVKMASTTGLDPESWRNEVVWCNPPYDDILPWVKVANMCGAKASALLLPPSIDTEWFDDLWPDNPLGDGKMVVLSRKTHDYRAVVFMEATRSGIHPMREIRFMRKRIRFLRPKRILSTLGDPTYDETDSESVVGEAPRAGNLVVVTYGQG